MRLAGTGSPTARSRSTPRREKRPSLSVIERDIEDRVRFRIIAFSKPRYWVARIAGPVARRLQLNALDGYLRGMQQGVDREAPTAGA